MKTVAAIVAAILALTTLSSALAARTAPLTAPAGVWVTLWHSAPLDAAEIAPRVTAAHVVPHPPQLPPVAVGPPEIILPRLTRIGGSGITATIPLLLTINDPVTGQFIREVRLEVENVDLTAFASSTLPAATFLSTAFANASSTLGALPISTRGTIIEDTIMDFDSSNNLVSIDVTANVEIFTTAYSERVRLELEGLPFTDFNPNSATISVILNSVKTNIINRFGQ